MQFKTKTNENQRKSVNDMEEHKENLKSVKSMKTNKKAWASRRWNKEIKEKVAVRNKKGRN